ncbi:uncharacterized protein G2W53_013793 [Senna tora]|uniref:Uncharacterized protein n=1 Tax=Senna tora TaxID=362788 RepID=A0A834U2Q7_9FABA|nr:uncharacterized protein G2W53_013793 [Senna tora]
MFQEPFTYSSFSLKTLEAVQNVSVTIFVTIFVNLIVKAHMKLEAKFKLPLRDPKMVLDKMLEAKNGGRKSASDKSISLYPVDDDVGLSDALNAPNCMPSNQHIISDTRKDLVANSNLDSGEVRHAINDTSNLLMNLSQIGDAANNTFVEVANYLYENLIGKQQAIKLGQQFMSAQNGELRIMSSNNFQGLPNSIESAMGFHDSSEISIDRLMSYAGKMANLFYNSYKAWYSKIIEDGYMIEDNEWTRLHATSKLGLELVAPLSDGKQLLQNKNKRIYQMKDAVLIALIREHDLVILNGFGEAVPQQPPSAHEDPRMELSRHPLSLDSSKAAPDFGGTEARSGVYI